ncbi:Fic/DOC family protein [Bradyrhizobium sp.]|uniref:Fic/DOC family protein n=1 Tax=Bradyrhizobium sp. TaxID=376 RepID=UPI003C710C1F
MYDAIDDPYTYENSTVLVNKLDLRDQDELEAYEAEISSARSGEPLPEGEFDFTHYCAVHRHLFQDVYIWAGKPRTVRMSKQGNPFCYPEHIGAQATKLFAELKADSFFKDLEPDDFSTRAAHFLSELNVIHAFREGNGRTQLTFFAMLADNAGHPLDLEKFDPDVMLGAMIESFEGDEKKLARAIRGLIA